MYEDEEGDKLYVVSDTEEFALGLPLKPEDIELKPTLEKS